MKALVFFILVFIAVPVMGQQPGIQTHGIDGASHTQTPSFGWYNVLHYGAKADDATDCSTAFQAAINATLDSHNLHNGTVYVPEGYYYLANTVTLKRNVQFIMDGNAHIRVPTGWTGVAFDFDADSISCYRAKLQGGYIYEGGTPSRLWTAVRIYKRKGAYADYIEVRNMHIYNAGIGIYEAAHDSAWITACTFSDLHLEWCVSFLKTRLLTRPRVHGFPIIAGNWYTNWQLQTGKSTLALIDTVVDWYSSFINLNFWDQQVAPTAGTYVFDTLSAYNRIWPNWPSLQNCADWGLSNDSPYRDVSQKQVTFVSTAINTGEVTPIFRVPWRCYVDSISYVCAGGTSPSVTPNPKYGLDVSAAGTALVTSPSAVTNTSTGVTVVPNNCIVPANYYVWMTFSAVAGRTRPVRFIATLYFHRVN